VFEPLACCLKGHMGAPLYLYRRTSQFVSRFEDPGSLVVESNKIILFMGLRLMSTSDCFPNPYLSYTKCLSHCHAVSRASRRIHIPLHRLSWPQIWEVRFTCGVKLISLCHGWGWYPPQTTSYIHSCHIHSVWAIDMLSQGSYGCTLILLYWPICLQIWGFGLTGGVKQCQFVMVKTNIHISVKLIPSSILDIYQVFEPLSCCLKGVWVHPYTVTSAKVDPRFGKSGSLWSENDVLTYWLRLISTSDHFIHP